MNTSCHGMATVGRQKLLSARPWHPTFFDLFGRLPDGPPCMTPVAAYAATAGYHVCDAFQESSEGAMVHGSRRWSNAQPSAVHRFGHRRALLFLSPHAQTSIAAVTRLEGAGWPLKRDTHHKR